MNNFVYDNEGRAIATISDGELLDSAGTAIGSLRHNNVYDRNGKFIFHLQAADQGDCGGRMTTEAAWKLFNPKQARSDHHPSSSS